jgi:23S rRNA (guanine745-N1)-methyltransferase
MNIVKAQNLACPIDGKPLELDEKQLVCEQGHAFDIARQGYINLLPVQLKRSKQPGDSKAMIMARTQFLNSGHYEPIAKKLAEIILAQMTENKEICLMDAGCGEGYYFDYILKVIKDKPGCQDLSFVGLDISKVAIIQSAKRNKQITWVVGTNRQPPVDDASVDIILCLFGFQSLNVFFKKLKPGGKVILVDPGIDHLKELRKIIYAEVKKSAPQDLSCIEESEFLLLDRQFLNYKTGEINREQLSNLLIMTPHFYRATKAGREAAAKVNQLDLTVDVVFSVLEKSNE